MMLQVKNVSKRLLLVALLVGAASTALAQSFSSGIFSVGATSYVRFAQSNLNSNLNSNSRELFQWSELNTIVPSGQRVLSEDEWHYLFTARTNAYSQFAQGRIKVSEGVYTNGLIILPDYETWTLPQGLTWNYTDTQLGYAKNTYTQAQWNQMEAAGAVFLPAAGYSSDGSSVTDANSQGNYWTSTSSDNSNAYCVQFSAGYFDDDANYSQSVYYSVRTVQNATALILSEYDSQETFVAKMDAARNKNAIDIYRTLQKAGSSFNTLCLPFNVEIGGSPLAGADVYSFVGATISNGVLLLNITPASSISAGVPYLVRWPNTTGETLHFMHFEGISWDGDNVAASSGSGSVLFQGFYGRTQITGAEDSYTTLFLGSRNNLYYPNNNGSSMKGFRAYFKIIESGGSTFAPGMPAVLNIVQSPNDATGWDAAEKETNQPRKELRNGQIVIIRNGETFLVNGQKL
ncbi:MAG: hypothetical protein IKO66_05035 [Paludibacteraceae bacterium]|nr:hypothetical protein [Paludibacteraceae bacterium]